MYIAVLISDERVQALYTWRPYDMKFHFWITWIHEFIGHFITASIHIVGDTMVPGFIMQLCCQLKLLEYRLNKFPSQVDNIQKTLNSDAIKEKFESSFISKSVKHHNTIFW
ncbi:uncharacterized protein LOC122501170 [Leptopilina heterotoma]|uniref:uncharacterized protein LOC122501170 n=1 Tax=Leptopilina heterotoma TaxID=63436 RepID=UPI001CA87904|nr:uncharacterized protein LOC122501170 [Leptopilina heterotoma]